MKLNSLKLTALGLGAAAALMSLPAVSPDPFIYDGFRP